MFGTPASNTLRHSSISSLPALYSVNAGLAMRTVLHLPAYGMDLVVVLVCVCVFGKTIIVYQTVFFCAD